MSDHDQKTYWYAADIESVLQCPGCGEFASPVKHRALHDHLEGVPGEWSFRECPACRSLFLDPRPARLAIAKAYSTTSYFTHRSGVMAHAADNGTSLFWRLANDYLNARFGCQRTPAHPAGRWLVPLLVLLRQQLDYFYRHLPRAPGRLLDVGCGNGAYLLRAAEAGWKVVGIEPDPAAATQAKASGLTVHEGDIHSFDDAGKFDVITLSHVFEHLHDPSIVLSRCRDLLKPRGMLWMSMPNIESLGHQAYGKAWLHLDPPRHLFLPSRMELQRLCRSAGYVNVQLLKRGRSGSSGMRLSAGRAAKLGYASGPDWLWQPLVNALSVFSTRWAEELVVIAYKDGA